MQATQNIPTIMIGFGATGDLMKVKVIPALYELHVARALPTMFRFMGFARRAWSAEEFQQYIREVIVAYKSDADEISVAKFLEPRRVDQAGEEEISFFVQSLLFSGSERGLGDAQGGKGVLNRGDIAGGIHSKISHEELVSR